MKKLYITNRKNFEFNLILPFLKVLLSVFFALCLNFDSIAQTPPVKYTLKSKDITASMSPSTGYNFLYDCSYDFTITDIIIPNKIGDYIIDVIDVNVFKGKGITSVEFEEGLKIIGQGAFSNNSLTGALILPASLISIGEDAFRDNNISSVTFKDNSRIQLINKNAFSENSQLVSIILPTRSNEEIEFVEYRDINDIKYKPGDPITDFKLLYFPYNPFVLTADDVEISSDGIITALREGFSKNSIRIPSRIGEIEVLEIGDTVFYAKKLFNVEFQEGLKTIGAVAFGDNFFSGNLTLPASLTTVQVGAFINNNFNGSLTLPTNIKLIGDFAFLANSFSGALTLPAHLATVGEGAFLENNFSVITFAQPSKIEVIGPGVFANNPLLSPVTLPSRPQDDTEFVGYTDNEGNSYPIGGPISLSTKVSYFAHQGTYTITDSDVEVNADGVITKCYCLFSKKNIIIPDMLDGRSIKGIGAGVFSDQSITGLTLPEGLENIGNNAFSNNPISGTLTIPSSVKIIGKKAFSQMSSSEVYFKANSSIKEIGEGAFQGGNSIFGRFTPFITLPDRTKDGYRFYWMKSLQGNSTEENLGSSPDIDPNESGTYTAVFVEQIKLTLEEPVGGNVVLDPPPNDDLGHYDINAKITFKAVPNEGYTFTKLNIKGMDITDMSYEIASTTSDINAQVFFAEKQLTNSVTLEVKVVGKGIVTPGKGISRYNSGSEVELVANDLPDYRFDKWIVGRETFDKTKNPKITLSSNTVATAYFIKQVTVTFGNSQYESRYLHLSPPGGKYDVGTEVTLSATNLTNLRFDKWVIGDKTYSDVEQKILLSKDIVVTASLISRATLTVTAVPTEGGTVTVLPATNSYVYDFGSIVKLQANPTEGYTFKGWDVDRKNYPNGSQILLLREVATATATFIKKENLMKQVTLSLKSSPEGIGSINVVPLPYEAIGTYDLGTEVTILSASSPEGYRFDKFVLGQTTVINKGQKVTLDKDTTLTAYYIKQVTLSLKSSPEGKGSLSATPLPNEGINTYDINTEVTITATTTDGYQFEKWVVGTDTYSENVRKIVLVVNTTATANFTPVLAVADAEKNLNSHFPNPVSDRLTVNTEGVKSVVLLSLDGRMLQESLPHGFETLQIDVSTLPTGVYLIQLTHDDGSVVINKVVKY